MVTKPDTVTKVASPPAAALVGLQIVFKDGVATLDGEIAVAYDPAAEAPDGAALKIMGRDLFQTGFSGLDMTPGKVCVGPAHAVYAAVNLAAQRGALKVSASGVSEDDQERLKPWLEKVKDQIEVSFL